MRPRLTATASFVCVGIALLAGCDNSTAGSPSPTSATKATLPYAGAPPVERPLDTSGIDADPCKAATSAEVEALSGVGVKKAESVGAKDKQCAWTLSGGNGVLSGGAVHSGDGLSLLYDQHEKGQIAVFQQKPSVGGYPAVVATNQTVGDGFCTLVVGIRDDATYTVPVSLDSRNPSFGDPCSVATKLAEVVVKRLQGA